MYIADPLFITLLSMLEPNSSLIQVKPKQLFPEIEPEHYITRRDQFALRDELQKEKAEKREAAKVEKEAKALAKAKSGPAKRGRPPKKSVESQGKSADQPEPADESCVNNAGTIDKSPMDNNASRAKKKARTGESKLVNQIKQSRAKKLVTSVETVGEAPDSNPNPPKEDAEPAEEESTLVKQSTRTGAKKAAAGPGDNLPKHKRAKKATAPETVDNSPMEDAQTPDIDIKPRRRSRAKKAAEPETIDKSPTDKSPMEDAKNQDIDIKLPKRSRAKKVAELETIDKSPTDKSPTDKSPTEDAKNRDIDIKPPRRSRAKKAAEPETIDKSPADKSPNQDKLPRRSRTKNVETSDKAKIVDNKRKKNDHGADPEAAASAAPKRRARKTQEGSGRHVTAPTSGSRDAQPAQDPVECLGESLGALGLEDKVVVEPAKVEPSPSNGRKRRPSTASASGKKRRKTVIIDMLQQPDSFEQAAVEIKKLFQHCRDCHHNADDHRGLAQSLLAVSQSTGNRRLWGWRSSFLVAMEKLMHGHRFSTSAPLWSASRLPSTALRSWFPGYITWIVKR